MSLTQQRCALVALVVLLAAVRLAAAPSGLPGTYEDKPGNRILVVKPDGEGKYRFTISSRKSGYVFYDSILKKEIQTRQTSMNDATEVPEEVAILEVGRQSIWFCRLDVPLPERIKFVRKTGK